MSEQPEQEVDDTEATAEGAAFNPAVKTEDNTGGFKPGRDDVEEND
jgi:hypothetical protein